MFWITRFWGINGIENFWNQAKRHMREFNGVPKEYFGLCLKECEWRLNTPDPKRQLTQPKQWVRRYMDSLSRTAPSLLSKFLSLWDGGDIPLPS